MKRFPAILLSLMLAVSAFADINVKGQVIDADGSEPLIGVSILVEGTTQGTITDFDGNFEITVPDKAVLQFSYIGYKTITVRAVPTMQVIMESDAQQLQEVVSLGYSAVKRAELSSAVVTVSAEELTDVTTADIGNMLQGKVAGVTVSNAGGQPGDAAQIRIRGTGSINAGSAPIYVVDGVVGGAFNPNDVETLSVLKDAGSTAIYGAQGAGGVIVVTTKSGKKGDKVHVDLKATAGAKQALFGNFRMMKSQELYNFHSQLFSPTVFKLTYPETLLDQDWNWQNEFFKTGVIQNYNVSVHGGSEHIGYYVSLDYFGEEGTLRTTGMQKVAGHASLKADITKWLDMNIKVDFSKSSVDYPSSWTMLGDAYFKMPWDCPYAYDESGNLTNQYVFLNSGKRPDNGQKWWSQETWNALHTSQYNYSRSDNFDFAGVLQLGVHFTDWLHFTTTNTFGAGHWLSSEYVDPRTYSTEYQSGYLGKSTGQSKSFGTTNILKGGYQWDKHSFNAMIGQEFSLWQSEYVTASGIGMPNGVQALNSCSPLSNSGYIMPGKGLSFFVQASYDFAKRYFITASYRTEGNSNFGSMHRWGHFPSVAASWLISNEEFMKSQNVVSFFKLRASYGITGNSDIPAYQYLSTYSLSALYQNNVAASPSRLANPDLHWETAYMAAVGIDLSFIKRIDMNIDLYQTDNTELLLYVPQPPSSGFYEVMQNAGAVRNRGIEFNIDANIINTKDWRWDVGFNIGFNQNRVTSLPNHTPIFQQASSVNQRIAEGEDIYTWWLKEWAGVDPVNGDPLWYCVDANGDYILDAAGNKTTTNDYNGTLAHAVGTATPLFSGGLSTQLSWKGIFIHLNSNFQYGNKIYNYTRHSSDADGAYLGYNQLSIDNSVLGWKRWTAADPNGATHPAATLNGNKNANQISSRYLEDGSYFRLKNLTVGYDFPTQLISKAKMTKCRIYFSADNLFTSSKFSGMDPEITLEKTTYSLAGFYSENYPVGRTFQGGIEISF